MARSAVGIRLVVVALAAVWLLPFPFPAGLGFVAAPSSSSSSQQEASKTEVQQRVDRRGMLSLGALATLIPSQAPSAKAFDEEDAKSEYVTFDVDVQGEDGDQTERVVMKLHPDWAPRGVRRFHTMMNLGDLDGSRIHHVRKEKGMVLFGLPAEATLPLPSIRNDRARASNKRGTVAFKQVNGGHAMSMNHREQELFINTHDNDALDQFEGAPIGEIIEGMDVIDRVYGEYGNRPHLQQIKLKGSEYLDSEFPKLGRIVSAKYAQPVGM